MTNYILLMNLYYILILQPLYVLSLFDSRLLSSFVLHIVRCLWFSSSTVSSAPVSLTCFLQVYTTRSDIVLLHMSRKEQHQRTKKIKGENVTRFIMSTCKLSLICVRL
jgi:hypothetical protein